MKARPPQSAVADGGWREPRDKNCLFIFVKLLSEKMKARVHAYVSGRVQGVFFRDFARAEADYLGLTGWVKNLWDGRVEVVAEGEKEDLEKLLGKLKQGPPGARVKDVQAIWENYSGEFQEFRITWY